MEITQGDLILLPPHDAVSNDGGDPNRENDGPPTSLLGFVQVVESWFRFGGQELGSRLRGSYEWSKAGITSFWPLLGRKQFGISGLTVN